MGKHYANAVKQSKKTIWMALMGRA